MIETFERKIIRFRANRTLQNAFRDNQSLALQMISRRGTRPVQSEEEVNVYVESRAELFLYFFVSHIRHG
jgi:hypothetical protein